MDIPALISTAYTSLTFVRDTLQVSLDHKVETESREKVRAALDKLGGLQDSLFQVREELFRLQTENDSLRAALKAKDDWAAQAAQYVRKKTTGGAVVYEFIGQPHHYACPACYTKSTIQFLQGPRGLGGVYQCPGCKTDYPVDPRQNLSIGIGGAQRARSSLSDF